MVAGPLSLFYGGLEAVIGPPLMEHGSLLEAMESEHTARDDSKVKFKSSNGMTSTSEQVTVTR